jgi:hypothetical protein
MKIKGMGVALAMLATMAATEAPGQIALGTAFTYQGRLTDGGNPASGNYDLRFTLFDDASEGNPVGIPVTLVNVAVAAGLFTVDLDFGAAAFAGSARWLEIGARPGGSGGLFTVLSPRQRLTPAPGALHATSATSAPANGLTGTTLASGVTASSLTSVGTLSALTVAGPLSQTGGGQVALSGNVDATAGIDVTGNVSVTGTVDGVDVSAHHTATTGVHGVGAGAIVGTTLAQTLTNKTLTSPNVTALTVTSGGASVTGGINNNGGGIAGAGSITGVGAALIASAGLAVGTGSNGNIDLSPNGTGMVTLSAVLRIYRTSSPRTTCAIAEAGSFYLLDHAGGPDALCVCIDVDGTSTDYYDLISGTTAACD